MTQIRPRMNAGLDQSCLQIRVYPRGFHPASSAFLRFHHSSLAVGVRQDYRPCTGCGSMAGPLTNGDAMRTRHHVLALVVLGGTAMTAASDEGMWLLNDPPRDRLKT